MCRTLGAPRLHRARVRRRRRGRRRGGGGGRGGTSGGGGNKRRDHPITNKVCTARVGARMRGIESPTLLPLTLALQAVQ